MPARRAERPIFHRVATGRTLHAFGDPMPHVPILGTPLRDHQRAAVESAGGELRDISVAGDAADYRHFVFDDDLYFTPGFARAAVAMSRTAGGSLRFGLAPNTFNDRFVLPHEPGTADGHRFAFRYVDGDGAVADAVVPQEVYASSVPLPDQIVAGGSYSCDQCAVFASRLASPFHLLQVNLAVNLTRLVPTRSRVPARLVNRLAPLHSRLYLRGLRRLNRVGRGCRIHPTAVLENAVLGRDVVVGANSIVRHSFIGAGTTIGDGASVNNSVLGERNVIASGNQLNLCMTYDDVFLIHGPYQFSIFGRSAAVFAVINCDIRLDRRTITIPTDAGLLDSRQPLLGIAYGHHSKVGGGNIIAAGRIVPNHRRIDPPPTIILKVE
jgi:hypothetical protein